MKPNYIIGIWMALFLAVLGGVLVFHKDTDDFAKGEFGGVPILLEYARTAEEREQGLSGRSEVPDNYGMLFVFETPDTYAFWMKDMLLPIDIFWLDAEKQVVSFKENASPGQYPVESYSPSAPALYVLETQAGFASKYGIVKGTKLTAKDIFWFSK